MSLKQLMPLVAVLVSACSGGHPAAPSAPGALNRPSQTEASGAAPSSDPARAAWQSGVPQSLAGTTLHVATFTDLASNGAVGAAAVLVAAASAPGAPIISVSVNSPNVTISWSPSGSGDAASTFTIRYSGPSVGGEDSIVARRITFGPLAPGSYRVQICATNSQGTTCSAPAAGEFTINPANSVPDPPTQLSYDLDGDLVSLSWLIASTGTPAVTMVVIADGLGEFPVGLSGGIRTQTPMPPGTYSARVLARNASGDSRPAGPISVVVPCSSLPAPQLSQTVSGSSVSLTWTNPSSKLYISRYLVTISGPSTNQGSVSADTLSYPVRGLAPGDYTATVQATAGGSCAAGATGTISFRIEDTRPGPPRSVTASADGLNVTVSWLPPAAGGPVDHYVVTANGVEYPVDASTRVSRQVPAGSYAISVQASSRTGERSEAVFATPNPLVVSAGCTFDVSPTVATMAATGNPPGSPLSLTISVTTQAGCAWTATAGPDSWVFPSLGSVVNKTGSGDVRFIVYQNPAGQARTTTVTVAGQTVTINQLANPTPIPLPTCTYSLNPTSTPVAATGTTTTAVLTTGCAWSVSSDAPWITITSAASGTGNATISYTVAANTGAARTGHLTVTGSGGTAQLTVAQSQGSPPTPCTYSLNPTSTTVTSSGGTATTALTAGCAWNVSSDATWITITSAASGAGNATISYTVAANTGAARTGHLTVTGSGGTAQLAVMQSEGTPTPTTNPKTGRFSGAFPSNSGTWNQTLNTACASTIFFTGTLTMAATVSQSDGVTGTLTVSGRYTFTRISGLNSVLCSGDVVFNSDTEPLAGNSNAITSSVMLGGYFTGAFSGSYLSNDLVIGTLTINLGSGSQAMVLPMTLRR